MVATLGPRPAAHWARVLLPMTGVVFCTPGLIGFNVLIPFLGERFAPGESGAALTAYGAGMAILCSLVLCPFNYIVANKLNNKTISPRTACLTAALAGLVGLGLAGVGVIVKCYPFALVSYGLGQGVSMGASYISLLKLTREWFAPIRRPGLGFGLLGSALGLAAAAFAVAAEALASSVGVGPALLILAGATAAITIPSALLVIRPAPTLPSSAPEAATPAARTSSASELMRSARFWFFWAGLLLALLPGWGFKLLVTSLLQSNFDSTAETGTLVTSLGLVLYSVSRLGAGVLTDYVPARAIYVAVLLVQVLLLGQLASMAMFGLPAPSEATYSALQVGVTICFGFLKTLYPVVCHALWPGNFMAVGLIAPCFGLAGALGPAVYLLSMALDGGEVVIGILWGFQVMSVILFVAALTWRRGDGGPRKGGGRVEAVVVAAASPKAEAGA